MPTYEYRCEACDHYFELEQRITEDPIKKCPKCGRQKARRLITQGNFILKGGGWYTDLYSKPPAKKSGADDSAGSANSADKSASKTSNSDSKPAKKAGDTAKKSKKASSS